MININIEKVFDLKNLNISHFKDDVFKLFDTYKFNLNELPRHERIRVHNILNELYYGLLKTKNDKRLHRKT